MKKTSAEIFPLDFSRHLKFFRISIVQYVLNGRFYCPKTSCMIMSTSCGLLVVQYKAEKTTTLNM